MTAREVDGFVVAVTRVENVAEKRTYDLCVVELPAAYDYDRVQVRIPADLKIMRDIGVRVLYDPDADPPTAEYLTVTPRDEASRLMQERSVSVLSAYGVSPLLDDIGAALGRVNREPEEFLTHEQHAARYPVPQLSIAPELERIIRDEIAKHAATLANQRHEVVITNTTVVTYGIRKSSTGGGVGYEISVTGTDLADMAEKYNEGAKKLANDVSAIEQGARQARQSDRRI